MIKKIVHGYEQYECSKCGTETYYGADYCQICGHTFSDVQVQNETYLNEEESEDETICIVVGAQRSGNFTFVQMKIDMTPDFLKSLSGFDSQRMMREPDPYEFYVFKTSLYPNLRPNQQINLEMDNYTNFRTSNGFKISFDQRHFSEYDIAELKTYNFNN